MSNPRDQVKNALIHLVGKKDPAVFQNSRKFTQTISEICPGCQIEIHALAMGLQERVPWEVSKYGAQGLSSKAFQQLSENLQAKHSFPSDLAAWSIETWAVSLGIKVELPAPQIKPELAAPSSPPPAAAQSLDAPSPAAETAAPESAPASVAAPLPPTTGLGIEFNFGDGGLVQIAQIWDKKENRKFDPPQVLATWVKSQEAPARPFISDLTPLPGSSAPISTPNQNISQSLQAGGKVSSPPTHASATVSPPPIRTGAQTVPPPKPVSVEKFLGPKPTAPKPPLPPTAEGQYSLGMAYLKGNGVPLSYEEAFRIFQSAASLGHVGAQCKVGEMFLRGLGVKENLSEAVRLFKIAAERGYAEAQVQLGSLYQCGMGVERDLNEAKRWFQLAAIQGHPEGKELFKQILEIVPEER